MKPEVKILNPLLAFLALLIFLAISVSSLTLALADEPMPAPAPATAPSIVAASTRVPVLKVAVDTGLMGSLNYRMDLMTGAEGEIGTLKFKPGANDIPFPFEKSLIAEYYSKV